MNPFFLQFYGTHANRKNGTVYETGFHQDFDKRVRVKFNFTLLTVWLNFHFLITCFLIFNIISINIICCIYYFYLLYHETRYGPP